jgi:acetoacetyl-CoA reductase
VQGGLGRHAAKSFGRIVNIGSINGQAANMARSIMRPPSRASTVSPRRSPRKARAKGITVNAIAPGYIDTEMVAAVPANVLEKIVARFR